MKINIMILKRFYRYSLLKKKFDIQELILICFEFRTLFDLKIKDDKTLLFIFKKEKKKKIKS
jgi:hypothetical protein